MTKLFAVFDIRAGQYMKVFPESSRAQALRGFDILVNDGKSIFAQYPDDFALMELAEFDDLTGKITEHVSPFRVAGGRECVRVDERQQSLFDGARGSGSPNVERVSQ